VRFSIKEKKENVILENEILEVSLRSPASCFGEAQFEHGLSQRVLFGGAVQPEYEFRCGFENTSLLSREFHNICEVKVYINPLTPNDPYSGRTAPLTSKRCILYIYSTNIGTEYFKHGIYSQFFP